MSSTFAKNLAEHEFKHIHHVSSSYLNLFFKEYEPVFVLTTGRSGSAFVKKILTLSSDIHAEHEAFPNMFLESNYAYHNQSRSEVLKKMFLVGRFEKLLETCLNNQIYVESNHCMVFYVRQIKEIFPNAKFIHLVRHPLDFIVSAIRKGWHKNDSVWELGRIKINDDKVWGHMNQIEKLSWYWIAVNRFIEEIKLNNSLNTMTVRLEDLVEKYSHYIDFLKFIGTKELVSESKYIAVKNQKVNKLNFSLTEPSNMYKTNTFPSYEKWDEEMKKSIDSHLIKLGKTYNYNF